MAEILGDSTANNLVGTGNGNDSIVGFEGDDTLWADWNWNIGNNTLDGGLDRITYMLPLRVTFCGVGTTTTSWKFTVGTTP